MLKEDLLGTIENLFISRKNNYPQQIDGKNVYTVINKPLTKEIIQRHLNGTITIGCWQVNDNKVKWICFDFDGDLKEEFEKAKKLFYLLKEKKFNPLLEFSGRRGYHIWIFIEPTDLSIARIFALEISKTYSPNEVFPKSKNLTGKKFGFQVKLPLGLHRVTMLRSYLFDENLKPLNQEQSRNFLIKIKEMKRNKIVFKNLKFFGDKNDNTNTMVR